MNQFNTLTLPRKFTNMQDYCFNEMDVVEQNPETSWFLISYKSTGKAVEVVHRETSKEMLSVALQYHNIYEVTPVQPEDFAAVYDKIYTVEVVNENKRRYYEMQRSLHN